jgi:hypothetical protein
MGSATPAWRLPNSGLRLSSIAVLNGLLAADPDKLPQESVLPPLSMESWQEPERMKFSPRE